MNYIMGFIGRLYNRRIYKESCTKSGLIPMKALNVCVNVLRFLKIYNFIYSISLYLTTIINRRKLFKLFSQFVKKDDLCFDIGANLGSRSEALLRLGARVVAVEPQSVCMKKLEKKYCNNKKISLVQKAVSDKIGEEEMITSNSHTVSSMSREWISSVKSSDMFFVSTSAFQWQKTIKVQATTMDELIKQFGKPAFCKIDVEGYEYEVLKGLTQPIGIISFEFTPTNEFINLAIKTIRHLSSIGKIEFNYSLGETMKLVLNDWITPEEMSAIIKSILNKTSFSGDIYARFI
ncbi:MAG: FkbM family methyltransferase [Actinomycetota bacterium]|nr:FkbM family methyltransferase [Actinomycetota bacterium]